jgi:hypothetical protein
MTPMTAVGPILSMKVGEHVRCDKRRQQRCASKYASLRVSAPRRSQLIGSTLAAHAVRDLPLLTTGGGAILGPITTPNPGNVGLYQTELTPLTRRRHWCSLNDGRIEIDSSTVDCERRLRRKFGRGVRHNLLGGENAFLDERAEAVV